MDLGNLLNALNQGGETSTLVNAINPGSGFNQGSAPNLAAGAGAGAGTGNLANILSLATTAPNSAAGGPPTAGNPAIPVGSTPQTAAIVAAAQRMEAASTPSTALVVARPAYIGSADVYESGAPASASLLAQSGVSAYIQLQNALSSSEQSNKAANQLTSTLGNASTTLKATYYDAVSSLPQQLQDKDWGFSIANGTLVFIQGQDELSVQDFADLQRAFAGAKVETAANLVATALTSIEVRQKSGDDSNNLAWGRLEVDENNFSDVVNLRNYVTATAPGGRYNPSLQEPASNPQIPNLLGGMDLRDLLSARPNFFHADGSARTDELDATFEEAPPAELTATLQGKCSCGEVSFEVEDAFEYAFFCHCSRCRRRTGSAFAAIAGIAIEKVEVTGGREHLLMEGECSDGYGARCARCHTFLFAAVRGRQYMHISLGSLVSTPTRSPDHHIYVGSKAPWFEITDALPQYQELP